MDLDPRTVSRSRSSHSIPNRCFSTAIKANGKVVGRFVPETEYRKMLYSSAVWACPFSNEELDRSFNQPGGSSLAEFWKRMGRQ